MGNKFKNYNVKYNIRNSDKMFEQNITKQIEKIFIDKDWFHERWADKFHYERDWFKNDWLVRHKLNKG